MFFCRVKEDTPWACEEDTPKDCVHMFPLRPKKVVPLIGVIQAHVDYLDCMRQCASSGEALEKIAKSSTHGLVQKILVVNTLSVEDGVLALNLVSESSFPEESQKQISQALDSKVSKGVDIVASGTDVKQTHNHLENYLTAVEWRAFDDRSLSLENKLMQMAKFLKTLHLVSPREPIIADAAVLALHAHGPLNPDVALDQTRTLKTYMSSVASAWEIASLEKPETYPSTPIAFKEQYPHIHAQCYGTNPAIPCPVDSVQLSMLRSASVCRSSKTGACSTSERARKQTSVVMQQGISTGSPVHSMVSKPLPTYVALANAPYWPDRAEQALQSPSGPGGWHPCLVPSHLSCLSLPPSLPPSTSPLPREHSDPNLCIESSPKPSELSPEKPGTSTEEPTASSVEAKPEPPSTGGELLVAWKEKTFTICF